MCVYLYNRFCVVLGIVFCVCVVMYVCVCVCVCVHMLCLCVIHVYQFSVVLVCPRYGVWLRVWFSISRVRLVEHEFFMSQREL